MLWRRSNVGRCRCNVLIHVRRSNVRHCRSWYDVLHRWRRKCGNCVRPLGWCWRHRRGRRCAATSLLHHDITVVSLVLWSHIPRARDRQRRMGATKRNTELRVLERFPKIQRLERMTPGGPRCCNNKYHRTATNFVCTPRERTLQAGRNVLIDMRRSNVEHCDSTTGAGAAYTSGAMAMYSATGAGTA